MRSGLLTVGLTGGIACGKSTVARMLEERGCLLVDADRIARELVEPGEPSHGEIVERFGEEILDAEGRIDRAALGSLVFGDDEARRDLEAILHPRIIAEETRRLEHADPETGIAVVEAALMVEAGSWRRYDRLVVVTASEQTRLRRMRAKGWDEPEARARMAAQMPVEEKEALADYLIDNDGTLEELEGRVREVYEALLEDRSRSS